MVFITSKLVARNLQLGTHLEQSDGLRSVEGDDVHLQDQQSCYSLQHPSNKLQVASYKFQPLSMEWDDAHLQDQQSCYKLLRMSYKLQVASYKLQVTSYYV